MGVGTPITYGKDTIISSDKVDVAIWFITVGFSPTVVEVRIFSIVESIDYSSTNRALLRGGIEFLVKVQETQIKSLI